MGNKLKNRIRYTSTIDAKLVVTLREYADLSKTPQSRLLDEGLELLFQSKGIPYAKNEKRKKGVN